MKVPFRDTFEGLPPAIADSLIEQLEEAVYLLNNRYWAAIKDSDRRSLSAEQISGKIFSIFDLAERIKKNLQNS